MMVQPACPAPAPGHTLKQVVTSLPLGKIVQGGLWGRGNGRLLENSGITLRGEYYLTCFTQEALSQGRLNDGFCFLPNRASHFLSSMPFGIREAYPPLSPILPLPSCRGAPPSSLSLSELRAELSKGLW